jgi:hypothetical protein
MASVFLSYSNRDHFFAELVVAKLADRGINVWRDQDQLRAGNDWRTGIEHGITGSIAMIVALSESSVASSYVTFEWAYALGQGKTVIPLKIGECKLHPKLETIQYLDFSKPGALPWDDLIRRISEVEEEQHPESEDREPSGFSSPDPSGNEDLLEAKILNYLDHRGYQMASFSRLRERIDESLTDDRLERLTRRANPVFRRATLRGGKPGLAKLAP